MRRDEKRTRELERRGNGVLTNEQENGLVLPKSNASFLAIVPQRALLCLSVDNQSPLTMHERTPIGHSMAQGPTEEQQRLASTSGNDCSQLLWPL